MFPGMSESIVGLCHGSGFSDPNKRKYLSLFLASLVWLVSAPWNGAERQHWCEEGTWISRSPEYTFTTVNTEFAAGLLFFLMSLLKWTKVVIKLISCVNFFLFFLHVVVENRNRKSSLCKLGKKSTVVGLHTSLNWPNWPSWLYLQLPWNCKQMLEPSFNGLPHLLRQHAAHQSSCN